MAYLPAAASGDGHMSSQYFASGSGPSRADSESPRLARKEIKIRKQGETEMKEGAERGESTC